MKPLEDYLKRRTDRADLARAAINVCHTADEISQATEVINKTAFTAKDVKYFLRTLGNVSSTIG